MATRIDGKALAAQVKARAAEGAQGLRRKPGLAVILVGDDPASRVYVTGKEKDCAECGFLSFEYKLPADTTQETLMELVERLNGEEAVDGILCQLPLPKHLNEEQILNAISPEKDVDCFHPVNVGRLSIGAPVFLPCTPAGVMEMLRAYEIPVAGKRCVVLGRSNIVGKPMAMLLLQQDGTVTVCHSRMSAVGRVGLITADMVKEGAVVIDVAMNRNEAGKLCGDVDYEAVEPRAACITPVPGGVGPMTRAMLMRNILTAARNHLQ